jgi:hypothetical protein
MRPADAPALLAMVRNHEGPESEQIAAYWFERQPEAVLVLRGPEGQPEGFLMLLQLQACTPEERKFDPAVRSAWEYLEQHAPLRTGERATYFRFWQARETYQQVSPNQSLIFVQMVRHYLRHQDWPLPLSPAPTPTSGRRCFLTAICTGLQNSILQLATTPMECTVTTGESCPRCHGST